MFSLAIFVESVDMDSTFASLPELHAANTERLKTNNVFLITKVLVIVIVVPIKLGKEKQIRILFLNLH